MNLILILFLFVTKSESSLKLVFSDEFNENDSIDQNKWDVEHEDNTCNGNWVNQLNCKTNNKTNLRVLNGTLALAAIRQKHLTKFFTSPTITTKQSFNGGRFEIRAALPKEKMLRPIFILIPVITSGRWPKDGEIDIVSTTQTPVLKYGIHFIRDAVKEDIGKESPVTENLNDFQMYVLEWTDSEVKFIFNDRVLHSINITKELMNNYNPFSKEFKLRISLGVGGYVGDIEFFPGQTLYEKDVQEWKCSLLMFDYIRVYQNVFEEVQNPVLPEQNNITSSNICAQVMPLIRPKNPKLKLIFSDNFTENELDQDNWTVKQDENYCDGNRNKQLNCNTNSSANVRLTDGTLVLAAIREKYLKSDYTSPFITSKRSFKYGRFEIRAALPDGKMLRPYIYMEPAEKHNNDSTVSTKDGKIDILSNTQLQEFYYGIHFAFDNNKKYTGRTAEDPIITDSLFNFHIYTMEWTETEIWWMFDNKHLFTASIHKELRNNYNPFDKTFKLVINLGVGGIGYFPGQFLKEEEADKWPCSLLIIDYIKVYEFSYESNDLNILEQNKISSSQICEKIMPLIRKNIAKEPVNYLVIALASIFSFLLILVIIPLNIFLFLRFKKSREAKDNGQAIGKGVQIELYDEVGNIYTEPASPSDMTNNVYAEYEYAKIGEENVTSRFYLTLNEYEKN